MKPTSVIPAWSIMLAWIVLLTNVPTRADELADALDPHVGKTIDLVELRTGRRFVRPLLEGVTQRNGEMTAVRLRPEGESKTVSVPQ